MREYEIAALPGDGIGKEVIAAGLQVLEAVATRDGGFRIAVERFPWSSEHYLKHGHYIPGGRARAPEGVRRDLLRRGRRSARPGPRVAVGPAPPDPRVRVRHRGEGHREPRRDVLDGGP